MVISKEKLREDVYLLYDGREEPDRTLAREVIDLLPPGRNKELSGRVELIKNGGGSTSVYAICRNSGRYFIKEFRAAGLKRKIKGLLGKSRAARSLKNGITLNERGLPAIKPAMAILDNSSATKRRSLLITEEREGENIFQLLRNCKLKASIRRKIIINLAEIWRQLFQENLLYRDPTLENFLLTPKENFRGKSPGIILIDIDHIRSLPIMPAFLKRDALSRFFASSLIYVDRAGADFPSSSEVSLFYSELFKGGRSGGDISKFSRRVEKGTVRKLKKWNRGDLIKKRC